MKLRKKVIASVVVLLGVLLGLECLREGWQGVRINMTETHLRSLSTWIELFRADNGQYPQTLSDLLTNTNEDESGKRAMQDLINDIQHNLWHDSYEYQPSSNGFTIIVTGPEVPPAGWFGKQHQVERFYKIGEALK